MMTTAFKFNKWDLVTMLVPGLLVGVMLAYNFTLVRMMADATVQASTISFTVDLGRYASAFSITWVLLSSFLKIDLGNIAKSAAKVIIFILVWVGIAFGFKMTAETLVERLPASEKLAYYQVAAYRTGVLAGEIDDQANILTDKSKIDLALMPFTASSGERAEMARAYTEKREQILVDLDDKMTAYVQAAARAVNPKAKIDGLPEKFEQAYAEFILKSRLIAEASTGFKGWWGYGARAESEMIGVTMGLKPDHTASRETFARKLVSETHSANARRLGHWYLNREKFAALFGEDGRYGETVLFDLAGHKVFVKDIPKDHSKESIRAFAERIAGEIAADAVPDINQVNSSKIAGHVVLATILLPFVLATTLLACLVDLTFMLMHAARFKFEIPGYVVKAVSVMAPVLVIVLTPANPAVVDQLGVVAGKLATIEAVFVR